MHDFARKLALTLTTLSVAAVAHAGFGERLLDHRTATVDMTEALTIVIQVEAGSLAVIGRIGATKATVEADFVARVANDREAERMLERLHLEYAVRGDRLVVKTRTANGAWGKEGGRINLTVTVPSALPLAIEDGSGWIKVTDMGSGVTIRDGSGAISVLRVGGMLDIEDGSGSINVENIGSSLRIHDGSGSINAEKIGGDVRISDGSGSISIADVGGDVVVSDSSGSIRVREVTGDFVVERDGSGSVAHSNIAGEVRLPR